MTPALRARLHAYAAAAGLTVADATERLIDAALRAHEQRRAAGRARAATRTPDEQRAAINARWKKDEPPA